MSNFYLQAPPSGGGGGVAGVSSLNGQTGALTLIAGTNITLTPGAGTLTIDASGGGSAPIYPANLIVFGDGVTPGGTTDVNFFHNVTSQLTAIITNDVGGSQGNFIVSPTNVNLGGNTDDFVGGNFSYSQVLNGAHQINMTIGDGFASLFGSVGVSATYNSSTLVRQLVLTNGTSAATVNWFWPTTDGTALQVLTTDGAGNLSFTTQTGMAINTLAPVIGDGSVGNPIAIFSQVGRVPFYDLSTGFLTDSSNLMKTPQGLNNSFGNINAFWGDGGNASVTGSDNNIVGSNSAATMLTSGSNNVGHGNGVFQSTVTGQNNIAVGSSAGATIVSGNGNVFLGFGADAASGSIQNSVALGNLAVTDRDNQLAIGRDTLTQITDFKIRGINYTMPSSSPDGFLKNTSGVVTWSGISVDGTTITGDGVSTPLSASAVSAPIYPATQIVFGDGTTPGGITSSNLIYDLSLDRFTILSTMQPGSGFFFDGASGIRTEYTDNFTTFDAKVLLGSSNAVLEYQDISGNQNTTILLTGTQGTFAYSGSTFNSVISATNVDVQMSVSDVAGTFTGDIVTDGTHTQISWQDLTGQTEAIVDLMGTGFTIGWNNLASGLSQSFSANFGGLQLTTNDGTTNTTYAWPSTPATAGQVLGDPTGSHNLEWVDVSSIAPTAQTATLTDNTTTPTDLPEMLFTPGPSGVSVSYIISYNIERDTEMQTGDFKIQYYATTTSFRLAGDNFDFDDCGITFSMSLAVTGQVQYISTNTGVDANIFWTIQVLND